MKIIAIANQKGGVGKTTTAVNLGSALQMNGQRVLLIDLDPQANLSSYLGFEGDGEPTISHLMMSYVTGMAVNAAEVIRYNQINELDFIPSDISLANADFYLIQAISREKVLSRILSNEQLKVYDYIIIDCLPSLGILLSNALSAADGIIIPVQTQKFALDGLTTLTNIYEQIKDSINPRLDLIGVLPTMVDNTNISKTILEKLKNKYEGKLFNTCISKSVEAANSSERMKALTLSNHKLGLEYTALAAEVAARLEP